MNQKELVGSMRKYGNFRRKKRKLGRIRNGKDVEDKNVLRKISRKYLYS